MIMPLWQIGIKLLSNTQKFGNGTDYVHFGSETTTITKGGELYAQTVKR